MPRTELCRVNMFSVEFAVSRMQRARQVEGERGGVRPGFCLQHDERDAYRAVRLAQHVYVQGETAFRFMARFRSVSATQLRAESAKPVHQ